MADDVSKASPSAIKRWDNTRYAAEDEAPARTRFGVGEVTSSRSVFADGEVLNPLRDKGRSKYASGEATVADWKAKPRRRAPQRVLEEKVWPATPRSR